MVSKHACALLSCVYVIGYILHPYYNIVSRVRARDGKVTCLPVLHLTQKCLQESKFIDEQTSSVIRIKKHFSKATLEPIEKE